MSTIDRQRVAAVRKLEAMGYTFAAGDWMQPANDAAEAKRRLIMKKIIGSALVALSVLGGIASVANAIPYPVGDETISQQEPSPN
jgi:hypothetical protein